MNFGLAMGNIGATGPQGSKGDRGDIGPAPSPFTSGMSFLDFLGQTLLTMATEALVAASFYALVGTVQSQLQLQISLLEIQVFKIVGYLSTVEIQIQTLEAVTSSLEGKTGGLYYNGSTWIFGDMNVSGNIVTQSNIFTAGGIYNTTPNLLQF